MQVFRHVASTAVLLALAPFTLASAWDLKTTATAGRTTTLPYYEAPKGQPETAIVAQASPPPQTRNTPDPGEVIRRLGRREDSKKKPQAPSAQGETPAPAQAAAPPANAQATPT